MDVKSGKVESFSGVRDTQASVVYLHEIGIAVGGKKMKIPALFSYDIAKGGYGILGQKGFFENHKILFEYSKKSIELKIS